MNRPLKQSVTDHLESYLLSDKQLLELGSLAEQAKPVTDRRYSSLHFVIAGAVAAFLLAFLLAPLLMEHEDVRERIALEVANNHIKLKPLEVETSSLEAVRAYFTKLDFVPVSSQLVTDSGLELIGGRYCSLQGITAAQLRLSKPNSSVVQTLYQTEYRKDMFRQAPVIEEGEEPVHTYAKGIEVKIWVEKGILFALTEIPNDGDQKQNDNQIKNR